MERKIYRSSSDYILTGVCGGIAEHFNIDTTLVRIAFVILSLGAGGGVLIYIILSLVIPKEGEKEVIKLKKMDVGHGRNLLGFILIGLGVLALINQIFPWLIKPELFWPGVLIAVGGWLIFR